MDNGRALAHRALCAVVSLRPRRLPFSVVSSALRSQQRAAGRQIKSPTGSPHCKWVPDRSSERGLLAAVSHVGDMLRSYTLLPLLFCIG